MTKYFILSIIGILSHFYIVPVASYFSDSYFMYYFVIIATYFMLIEGLAGLFFKSILKK